MTQVEYDEMSDDYYFVCEEAGCGATGRGRMRYQDANRDADYHDQLHEDGAI